MADPDTKAIRARYAVATPGPWAVNFFGDVVVHDAKVAVVFGPPGGCVQAGNSAFIAAARTDVPVLCDAVDARDAMIAELRAELARVTAERDAAALDRDAWIEQAKKEQRMRFAAESPAARAVLDAAEAWRRSATRDTRRALLAAADAYHREREQKGGQ